MSLDIDVSLIYGPGIAIVVIIVLVVIFCVICDVSERKNHGDKYIINSIMDQIHTVFNKYENFPADKRITYKKIEAQTCAYFRKLLKFMAENDREKFISFFKNSEFEKWSLSHVSGYMFDLLGSSECYFMCSLNQEGQAVRRIYTDCLDKALEKGYIDETLHKNQTEALRKHIISNSHLG